MFKETFDKKYHLCNKIVIEICSKQYYKQNDTYAAIRQFWNEIDVFDRLCSGAYGVTVQKNIWRHKIATVFQNSMCEISFMTQFNQQRCRCLTVQWEVGLLNSVQSC